MTHLKPRQVAATLKGPQQALAAAALGCPAHCLSQKAKLDCDGRSENKQAPSWAPFAIYFLGPRTGLV